MTRREGRKAGRQEFKVARQERRQMAPHRLSALLPCVPALLLCCLPAMPAQAQEPPSFKSGSAELVVLPVVVTDKQGQIISDLTTEQFAFFDNGRHVQIDFFTNEDTPVTVGLVVDASGSM